MAARQHVGPSLAPVGLDSRARPEVDRRQVRRWTIFLTLLGVGAAHWLALNLLVFPEVLGQEPAHPASRASATPVARETANAMPAQPAARETAKAMPVEPPPAGSVEPSVAVPPDPRPRPAEAAVALYFDWGTFAIRRDTRARVLEVVRRLKRQPELTVELVGHADPIGSPEKNRRLGVRRAEVVRDYLVVLGVDPSRIRLISPAVSEQPLPNDHPATHARLRRVDVSWN